MIRFSASETADSPDAKGSIDVRGATVETTKARKFNLNVPLATAIPGYVPPKQRKKTN